MPSANPAALNDVGVSAAEIVTEFHAESVALVMLALVDTVTDVFTRYAVPVSVLCTVADPAARIVAEVRVTVGAVESEVRVTVIVVVAVTDDTVTATVIVLVPTVSEIGDDALPNSTDEPLTVIVALPLDAVGVTATDDVAVVTVAE